MCSPIPRQQNGAQKLQAHWQRLLAVVNFYTSFSIIQERADLPKPRRRHHKTSMVTICGRQLCPRALFEKTVSQRCAMMFRQRRACRMLASPHVLLHFFTREKPRKGAQCHASQRRRSASAPSRCVAAWTCSTATLPRRCTSPAPSSASSPWRSRPRRQTPTSTR